MKTFLYFIMLTMIIILYFGHQLLGIDVLSNWFRALAFIWLASNFFMLVNVKKQRSG